MRQRVMIAMALALEPEVLIADEPTTALDVTIQAQILRLLEDLNREQSLATILITHDLGVVAEVADRVLVMYAGRVVEQGTLDDIFYDPQHPYTWGLFGLLAAARSAAPEATAADQRGAALAFGVTQRLCVSSPLSTRIRSLFPIARPGFPPQGCTGTYGPLLAFTRAKAPETPDRGPDRSGGTDPMSDGESLLEVTDVVKHFPIKRGLLFSREVDQIRAVEDVTLSIGRGETLGLVGQSGCGKSTLCRTILQLIKPTSGSIRFEGRLLAGLSRRQLRLLRRDMQMIFQDPFASLNPRKRVGQIVGDPLKRQRVASGTDLRRRVYELLERVGLATEHYNRFPHEFSGGQRQRIGIARALASQPKLVVADEPVSALDVSIQAQIINLLADLQDEFGLTYLFVAHDIGVVRHISDRIAVMSAGKIVEEGPAERVCKQPSHPYTKKLLAAVPVPDPRESRARRRASLEGA